MKIDPNLTIGGVSPSSAMKPAGKAGVFEQVLSGLEQTAPAQTAGLASLGSPMINPQTLQGLSVGEQAIDLLDGYAQSLNDASRSLKSITPMMEELAELKPKLDEAAGALSDGDPLKGILQDVSATIESEVTRFQRGDLLM